MSVLSNEFSSELAEGIAALGWAIDPNAQIKLVTYLELLTRWNRIHNLTAIVQPIDMVRLHVLDSLSVVGELLKPERHIQTLLDVGSGAGLPGIILAIACPALRITSIDSVAKKISFQAQAKAELRLDNFTPLQTRVQQLRIAQPFDAAICRAFSSLIDFADHCERLVKPGAPLFAMKGEVPNSEIDQLTQQGFGASVERLTVPKLDAERHLIILKTRKQVNEK